MASHQAERHLPTAGLLIAVDAGCLLMAEALPLLHLADIAVASVSKHVKAGTTASHKGYTC